MKRLKTLMIAGIASTFAGTALAQATVPNTFTPGTAASASQVNANFTALANAIDNLAARVTLLESPLNKPSVTLNDLVGKTYCITNIGAISGQANNFARFSSYVSKSTLMITSTTQASLNAVSDDEHELGVSATGAGLTGTITHYSNLNPVTTVTISGLSNGVLATSIGNLYLAKDGTVLLSTDFTYTASQGDDSMAVGTLCQ